MPAALTDRERDALRAAEEAIEAWKRNPSLFMRHRLKTALVAGGLRSKEADAMIKRLKRQPKDLEVGDEP